MNAPVKSKINIAAIALSGLTILLMVLGIEPALKAEILTFAGLTIGPLIVVFRTWFTAPRK